MLLTGFCRHPGSGRSFFFLLIDVNGLSQEIIVERFFDSFYGISLEAISISRRTIDYFGVTHSPCNLVSYQQFYKVQVGALFLFLTLINLLFNEKVIIQIAGKRKIKQRHLRASFSKILLFCFYIFLGVLIEILLFLESNPAESIGVRRASFVWKYTHQFSFKRVRVRFISDQVTVAPLNNLLLCIVRQTSDIHLLQLNNVLQNESGFVLFCWPSFFRFISYCKSSNLSEDS